MADFCTQCSIDIFGKDYGDAAGQCGEGFIASFLCEGCGPTWVDHTGKCVASDCPEHAGKRPLPEPAPAGRLGARPAAGACPAGAGRASGAVAGGSGMETLRRMDETDRMAFQGACDLWDGPPLITEFSVVDRDPAKDWLSVLIPAGVVIVATDDDGKIGVEVIWNEEKFEKELRHRKEFVDQIEACKVAEFLASGLKIETIRSLMLR